VKRRRPLRAAARPPRARGGLDGDSRCPDDDPPVAAPSGA